jgi:hypothetical protein
MATFADHINTIMAKAPVGQTVEADAPEYWCDCYSAKVSVEGDLCPRCTKEHTQGYQVMSLIGRAANGMQLDSGIRYHAVPFGTRLAKCGAKPGRRSAGWSSYHGDDVTCPRCLKKLEGGVR